MKSFVIHVVIRAVQIVTKVLALINHVTKRSKLNVLAEIVLQRLYVLRMKKNIRECAHLNWPQEWQILHLAILLI